MKKMEARKSVNKLVDKLGIGFGETFIEVDLYAVLFHLAYLKGLCNVGTKKYIYFGSEGIIKTIEKVCTYSRQRFAVTPDYLKNNSWCHSPFKRLVLRFLLFKVS